jgi:hypothetical protein
MREPMLPASARCPSALRQTAPFAGISYGNPNDFKSGASGHSNSPATTAGLCPSGNTRLQCEGSGAGWRISRARPPPSSCLVRLLCKGNSIMIPPPLGTFGTMGRNTFPDSGFRNCRFLGGQELAFWRALHAQFRGGVLQHFQPSQLRQSLRRTERFRFQRSFRSVASDAVVPLPTSPPPTRPSVPAARVRCNSGLKTGFLISEPASRKSGPGIPLRPHFY